MCGEFTLINSGNCLTSQNLWHLFAWYMSVNQKSSVAPFLLGMFILTLLCAVFQYMWNAKVKADLSFPSGHVLLGIIVALVTGAHLLLVRAAKGSAQEFIRMYMASSVFKFLLYILVLVGFIFLTVESRKAIILCFLVYYVVFTVFEIVWLYTEMAAARKSWFSTFSFFLNKNGYFLNSSFPRLRYSVMFAPVF